MEPRAPVEPVLSARIRFYRHRLFFGRASLFSNCLRINGWSLFGRVRMAIDVAAIEHVAVDLTIGSSNLLLTIDGKTERLQMENGTILWERTLADLAGIRRPEALLPDKLAA